MKICSNIKEIRAYVKGLKEEGKVTGLVPTMGYLHEGHLSLMRAAKKNCDISIVSIFVNPAQFGPNEDFKRYPRDFKRDERLAKNEGMDAVFYPAAKSMYPPDYRTYVNVDGMTEALCGASRPGHFRGVTTVVTKLFNIVQPDIAYFGQKDAQQALVLKKMTSDLDIPVRIEILPIIRESDGLAMSSRNSYLSRKERQEARVLYEALKKARRLIKKGERSSEKIVKSMCGIIRAKKSAVVDYVSIVDMKNLKELKKVKKGALIALAVWIGKTRLIDNIIVR